MGYPELRAASSLPQLRLVLNGISCARVTIDARHGVSQLRDISFTLRMGLHLPKGYLYLLLSAAGLDPSLYSGHSFCIGTVTSAAQAYL